MQNRFIVLTLIFLLLPSTLSLFNIESFGAIPKQDTSQAHKANAKAFIDATIAANNSDIQRVVKVPSKTFYFHPVKLTNIYNISFVIEGKMAASKSIRQWPTKPGQKSYEDFISFYESSYLQLHGGGKIDGRGYHWWLVCILNIKKLLANQNYRPHLIRTEKVSNFKIHDLVLKNSAQFHVKLDQATDIEIYNVHILVNTTAQINLFKKFSLEGAIPLFPLNTDGIDPSGARVKVYNITVQNFDDVVVPKPSHTGDVSSCSEEMQVQNATVVLGVGMSIGSISPSNNFNCIRNISFKNVYMIRPLKGIYVKTNPGDQGKGVVENILYKNFTMDRPIWWAIYIGPQQMKEPDGDGPGCMFYPYDPKGQCTTQPLVTLRNITLQDVQIHNSLLYPVTIRCNVSNPCTEFNFYNVKTDKWRIGQKQRGYVCEYAILDQKNVSPFMNCVNKTDQPKNLQKQDEKLTKQELKMLFEEMEKAALEVGYHEEDDEFAYDFDPEKEMAEELLVDQ